MTDSSFNRLQLFPIIQAATLFLGTMISFTVAASRKDVSLYLPFVSETGAYSPEMCIFSFTLILGSFFGSIIYIVYFVIHLNTNCSTGVTSVATKLNVATVITGLASMIGLAGVAAFPMTTVFWTHLVFAGIYFSGSAFYFTLITVVTFKTEGKSRMFKYRFMLSALILVFLFFIMILFPTSLTRWHAFNKKIPALKDPNDKGFTLVLLSSVLEWLIVIVILLFNLSFFFDLKKHTLIYTITETNKSTTENNDVPNTEN